LIDSGSPVNIIDEYDYNLLKNKPKLFAPINQLAGYGSKTPIEVLGCFEQIIKYGENETNCLMYVAAGHYGSLLSSKTTESLKMDGTTHQFKTINQIQSLALLTAQYPKLFADRLGCIKNILAKIYLDENVKPVIMANRPLPFHLRAKVLLELQRMIDNGVIEMAHGPTTWLSAMVIVTKENGDVRICTDGRAIKKAIKRERHPLANLVDIKHTINGSEYFSKIDLKNGYHQVQLDESSRQLTAFQTPLGPMRYKRLNMGISCASEIFQRIIQDILAGIPNQINISDDILIYAKTMKEHDIILHRVLRRLEKAGITVNTNKCEFQQTKLIFFGMQFSRDGIAPDPAKVDAIKTATSPKTYDELRSFLGLGAYVQTFIKDFSTISEPLWKLAKSKENWKWSESNESTFLNLKNALSSAANAYFNPDWDTIVIADASGVGLGAVLVQVDPKNRHNRHIVECASRLLSETEQRYNHVEKEALASVWACEKFHIYLYGKEFNLITDNKAVDLIYNNPKSKPPSRIQRWALRLTPYDYTIQHEAGKTNIADYLSRRPSTSHESETDTDLNICVNQISHFLSSNTITKDKTEIALDNQINTITKYYSYYDTISTNLIINETAEDSELQLLIEAINNNNFEHIDIKKYKDFKNDFWITSNGLIMRQEAIVIPKKLQHQLINIAHESHQGISGTMALLKHKVYFYGMSSIIKQIVQDCQACQASSRPVKSTY